MENDNTTQPDKLNIAGVTKAMEQNADARTSLNTTIDGIKKQATEAEKATEAFVRPIAEHAGEMLVNALKSLPENTGTALSFLALGYGLAKLFETPKRPKQRKSKR